MEWNGQWPEQPASTTPILSMRLDSKPWKSFQSTCFCDSKTSSCCLTCCRAGSLVVLLLQQKFNLHPRWKLSFYFSSLMVQTRNQGIKAPSQTHRMNLFKGYFHSFAPHRVNSAYSVSERKNSSLFLEISSGRLIKTSHEIFNTTPMPESQKYFVCSLFIEIAIATLST